MASVNLTDLLLTLVGERLVLDALGPWVYIGILSEVGRDWVRLEEVDAHDLRDSGGSRERYVLAAREHRPAPNRGGVWIPLTQVASFSRLDEVIRYA